MYTIVPTIYVIANNFPYTLLFLFCFNIGIKNVCMAKPCANAAAKSTNNGSAAGTVFGP